MPRSHEVQSGPEDTSEAVDYGDDDLTEINAENKHDGDDDSDIDTRRRQRKQPASSSSQQLNHIKESALNARTAASSAASNSSAANNTGESNDLRLITLVKRYERKLNDISKRDLAEREKASSSSSKRRKSSSSRRRSSDTSSSSDNGFSSDSGDSSDGDNHGHGGRSSSSKDSDGKDITLRQLAIMNKIVKLKYVDISIFSRANLNVR